MTKRGAVSLVFDDGYQEIFDLVLPLLRKYKIKATFGIPINTEKVASTEGAPVTSLEKWKETAQKEGHEIAAHGIDHLNLTTLSELELDKEMKVVDELTQASTIIYPGGAYDEKVKSISQKYYSAGRTTEWGFEKLKPTDLFALKTFNANRNNFNVNKWNLFSLSACLANLWMIETYHRVTEDPKILHSVSLSDLEKHLNFISRLPIKIGTINEIVKRKK